jgi:hypothetical protein
VTTLQDLVDELAGRREVLLVGLLLSLVVLVLIGRKVRAIARSERPDEPLAAWAMLIGLGWSSEAIWEITRVRLGFALGLTLLLFVVNELALVLSMLRAKRHQIEHGWPGRFGQTAWGLAVLMAVIAASISTSLPEAILRAAIPLVVTKLWWDGLIPGRRPGATSWRWTPRHFLIWVGAIQPGEQDVATVHRERLTRQLVSLEFRRRHGARWLRNRRAGRLARLSLAADEGMIDEARARLGRSRWFEAADPRPAVEAPVPGVVARHADLVRRSRIRHGRSLRAVRTTHPRQPVTAAQMPVKDVRTAEEKALVVAAIQAANTTLKPHQVAHLAAVSESTARRRLRQPRVAEVTEPRPANGHIPALTA